MVSKRRKAIRITMGSLASGLAAFGAVSVMAAAPAAAYGPTGATAAPPPTTALTGLAFTQAPPAAPSAPSALAFTGADVVATTLGGAVAIGAGGVLVLATRSRKRKIETV